MHVVFFEEGFALIPVATARGVEQSLLEQFAEDLMLSLVVFELPKDVRGFVYDSRVDPCWRETTQVRSLAGEVDAVLFLLLVIEKDPPSRVYLFKDF